MTYKLTERREEDAKQQDILRAKLLEVAISSFRLNRLQDPYSDEKVSLLYIFGSTNPARAIFCFLE